jgi:hypothetical protein
MPQSAESIMDLPVGRVVFRAMECFDRCFDAADEDLNGLDERCVRHPQAVDEAPAMLLVQTKGVRSALEMGGR